MTERKYIVEASGRKSKPSTEARIREMFEAGSIPEDATIRPEDGSGTSMAVDVFLVLPPEERYAGSEEPVVLETVDLAEDLAEPAPLRDSVAVENVWQPADNATTITPRRRSRSKPMGGSRSPRLFRRLIVWLFNGFEIPRQGVDETRDYLQSTIGWIEFWLKCVHFASLLVLAGGVYSVVALTYLLIKVRQENLAVGWDFAMAAVAAQLGGVALLLVVFVGLRILEAFLRVIPACMRYWIELQEEQRDRPANS